MAETQGNQGLEGERQEGASGTPQEGGREEGERETGAGGERVRGDEDRGDRVAAVAPSDRDVVADTVAVVARALVDHPDAVRVFDVPSDRGPRYRLDVHPDDVGRVIGRGGHIARSIRQVARAAAARAGISVYLEIGD